MAVRPTEPIPPRRTTVLGWALRGALGLVLLAVAGVAFLLLLFDPNSQKPRIEAALHSATGQKIVLDGPIRLEPALVPTVSAERVRILSDQGFSRPELATARKVEASLALLPLLGGSIEVARIRLDGADILLERRADGRANWERAGAPPEPPAPANAPAQASAEPTQLHIADLAVTDSRIRYEDARANQSHEASIASLTLRSPRPGDPMRIELAGTAMHQAVTVAATTGSLTRLLDGAARSPFPVDATLRIAGATLHGVGTLTEPLAGRGYAMRIDGTVPDTASLASLLPVLNVAPRAERLSIGLQATDRGQALPALEALEAKAGRIDLGLVRPGLAVHDLVLAAPESSARLALTGQLALDQARFALTGSLPPPARLAVLGSGAAAGSFGVQLGVEGEGARFSLDSQLRPTAPRDRLAGKLDLAVADLARIGKVAGLDLPALQNLALSGQLADLPPGTGVALRNLRFSYGDSLVEGQVTAQLQDRPRIEARLSGPKLDLGPFLLPEPATTDPAAPAPAPPPATTASGRVLPDTPLPIASLPPINGSLDLRLALLVIDQIQARDVHLAVKLQGGRLDIEPLQATLPQGTASLRLSVDSNPAQPPVHVAVLAPAIQAAPLFRAAGLPPLSGALGIDIDLRGQGTSVASILGTSTGHVSLGMEQGTLDLSLLRRLGGDVLRAANLSFSQNGTTVVHCLAIRFDHANGVASARALDLNTDILTVAGSGSVNLANETLSLRVTPTAKTAALGIGPGIAVPLRIGGTMAAPRASPDPQGVAREAVNTALNLGIPGLGIARGLSARADTGCSGSDEPAAAAPQPSRPNTPAEQLRRVLPGLPAIPGLGGTR